MRLQHAPTTLQNRHNMHLPTRLINTIPSIRWIDNRRVPSQMTPLGLNNNRTGWDLPLTGPLQLVITWYKKHLAGEQSSTSHIQNKATQFQFSLFWIGPSAQFALQQGVFYTMWPLTANGIVKGKKCDRKYLIMLRQSHILFSNVF